MTIKEQISTINSKIKETTDDIRLKRHVVIELKAQLCSLLSPFSKGDRIKHKETGEILMFDGVISTSGDSIFDFEAYRIKLNGETFKYPQRFYNIKEYEAVTS